MKKGPLRMSINSVFKFVAGFLLLMAAHHAIAQMPPILFEQSNGKQTPAYREIISWWTKADKASGNIKLLTMGATDAGFPLHLAVLSANGEYDFASIRRANKRIILVNNGIHPGEPDGIDASMILARDVATGKKKLPDNVVVALIPVYNIGGCLNRSTTYRVDQNGPEAFGSRGNSQNLDLNRDFIKADSKEALSFAAIFHLTDPDIFIDNHVSNGADYQHVMTLLSSQHDKLGGAMGEYLHQQLEPAVYSEMKKKGYDLIPYVNFFGNGRVEDGWTEFWDSPRYSSGYASLWHSFAFVPETHMLKPYPQRVNATLALMETFIALAARNSETIARIRATAKLETKRASRFPLQWKSDSSSPATITFRGYASGQKPSEVSGLPRLVYDRTKPYTKAIPFYNQFQATQFVSKPKAYILPQGWRKVAERLKANNVHMRPLPADTTIEVEAYTIASYESAKMPYEGHHINRNVKTSSSMQTLKFRKGDYYIPMNQEANRFLVETLEPEAEDAYFVWNFFDPVLTRKEHYSSYAFQDSAAAYLGRHPELQSQLKSKKQTDTAFATDAEAQLEFVYEHSPWAEPAFRVYPVYRVK